MIADQGRQGRKSCRNMELWQDGDRGGGSALTVEGAHAFCLPPDAEVRAAHGHQRNLSEHAARQGVKGKVYQAINMSQRHSKEQCSARRVSRTPCPFTITLITCTWRLGCAGMYINLPWQYTILVPSWIDAWPRRTMHQSVPSCAAEWQIDGGQAHGGRLLRRHHGGAHHRHTL